MKSILNSMIVSYYAARNYKWPGFQEAMGWVATEIGEVHEVDLARRGDWVRNHPDDHPPFSHDALEKELSDAIMMLQVAGMTEGLDPIGRLEEHLSSRVNEYVLNSTAGVKQEDDDNRDESSRSKQSEGQA